MEQLIENISFERLNDNFKKLIINKNLKMSDIFAKCQIRPFINHIDFNVDKKVVFEFKREEIGSLFITLLLDDNFYAISFYQKGEDILNYENDGLECSYIIQFLMFTFTNNNFFTAMNLDEK